MKKYMVVPGPQNIVIDRKDSIQKAMDVFSAIINEQSQKEWEYHSMESIRVSNKPGCINRNPQVTYCYMLIFVKEVN